VSATQVTQADALKALAKEYIQTAPWNADTVEIAAFVEWAYQREGMDLEPMSTLSEIEAETIQ
jgi:hypothetical protein